MGEEPLCGHGPKELEARYGQQWASGGEQGRKGGGEGQGLKGRGGHIRIQRTDLCYPLGIPAPLIILVLVNDTHYTNQRNILFLRPLSARRQSQILNLLIK